MALRLYRFNCGVAAPGKWWGKTPWDGTRKIFNPIKTPFVVGNWVYPLLKGSNTGEVEQLAPTIHQPMIFIRFIRYLPLMKLVKTTAPPSLKFWICQVMAPHNHGYVSPPLTRHRWKKANWEHTIDGSEIPNNHRLDV